MELDEDLMEELLAKLNWKSGIRPLGDIANELAFVQKQIPYVKRLVKETQSSSILVTQSSWTNKLIDNGVISDLNDDITMRSLSELHLLFHTRQQQPAHRTFHRLQFDSQAYFSVNQILRPTVKFKTVLESALDHLPDDPNRAWQELCKVWHDFGFLWPQKIILGYSYHIKHSYQVENDEERLYQLQSANEITATAMDIELKNHIRPKGLSPSTNENHQNNNSTISLNRDYHRLRQSALSWKIIKRTDVKPIYEFLPIEMRDVIYQLIKQFVYRIPLNQPFLLRNVCTGGYLCWRNNIRQQVQNLQQQLNENSNTIKQDHFHKPYLFATTPITDSDINLFTWNFTYNLPNDHPSHNINQEKEKYVKCGSQLYLSPFYNNNNNHSSSFISHPILTSNLSDSMKARHWNPILEKTTRVRSLEFTNLSSSSIDLSLQQQNQHTWTIETPDLGLDHDDDISSDGHLNIDLAIGRLKPILHKEIISLRQILYLCSVKNQVSRSISTNQGNHRLSGINLHHHPPVDDSSESPFMGIPSPVPPAAAAVMAMVQNDFFEEDISSDPTFSNNNNKYQQHNQLNESNIISSNSTLPLTSTTANTSQTSLPFYNLQTYTVLPNPSKIFSPMISPSNSISPFFSSTQQYHQLNPVLAKEQALISGLEESYWIIELLSQLEIEQNDLQQQQNLNTHQQKQQKQNKRKKRSLANNNESNIVQPQLKMVMSLDNLREDENTKQINHPFKNNNNNNNNNSDHKNHHQDIDVDHISLRRVQSYSSVYDHKYHYQQQKESSSSNHHHFSGILIEKNNDINKKYRDYLNNNNNKIIQQQQNHHDPTNALIQDQNKIKEGFIQDKANNNVQPYLRLYASKQSNKTWSHFIKQSTLTNIKRWLKSQ